MNINFFQKNIDLLAQVEETKKYKAKEEKNFELIELACQTTLHTLIDLRNLSLQLFEISDKPNYGYPTTVDKLLTFVKKNKQPLVLGKVKLDEKEKEDAVVKLITQDNDKLVADVNLIKLILRCIVDINKVSRYKSGIS